MTPGRRPVREVLAFSLAAPVRAYAWLGARASFAGWRVGQFQSRIPFPCGGFAALAAYPDEVPAGAGGLGSFICMVPTWARKTSPRLSADATSFNPGSFVDMSTGRP